MRKGNKMQSVPEARCKVHHDERACAHCERACAHCEGAHGYGCNRQVCLLAVLFAGSGTTTKSVRQSVSLGR